MYGLLAELWIAIFDHHYQGTGVLPGAHLPGKLLNL